MRSRATAIVFILALPITAAAQNLQPQSQQEFQRVYGASSRGNPQAPPANLEEFSRVLGQQGSIAASAGLQKLSTPESINSTVLTELLKTNDPLRYFILWHSIATDVAAIDHNALLSSSPTTYHEQLGPARTARALALVHQAMFEAANIFDKRYKTTLPNLDVTPGLGASRDAALVEAAYQTILWLYPGLKDQPVDSRLLDPQNNDPCLQTPFNLPTYYQCSLNSIQNPTSVSSGIEIGRAIAGRIIADRSRDGAEISEPVWNVNFVPRLTNSNASDYDFKQWQIDPVSKLATALGGQWGGVKPFFLNSAFQFRPEEARSPEMMVKKLQEKGMAYTKLPSYNAIAKWGQDVRLDGTGKSLAPGPSGDGFFVAQFWAYDGTINLCAPARMYNQLSSKVLEHLQSSPDDGYQAIDFKSVVDIARFYALINFAMGDASIAAWDAKYYFQFPRPVTYIRAAQAIMNPPPVGSPEIPRSQWFPLGAQNTNSDQPYNVTPDFPAYPSGHAVFGGALFGVLRQYMKPDAHFQFISDEFNGKNRDVFNYLRCSGNDVTKSTKPKFCSPRMLTLNCAERENADSRLFMGVHWVFDADDGIYMGNQIAGHVFRNAMQPLSAGDRHDLQLFSADYTKVTTRKALVCDDVSYPDGWDNTDPTIGLGPLSMKTVK